MKERFGVEKRKPEPEPCPHEFPFAVVRIKRTNDSDTCELVTLAYGDELTLTYDEGVIDIVHHYREGEVKP